MLLKRRESAAVVLQAGARARQARSQAKVLRAEKARKEEEARLEKLRLEEQARKEEQAAIVLQAGRRALVARRDFKEMREEKARTDAATMVCFCFFFFNSFIVLCLLTPFTDPVVGARIFCAAAFGVASGSPCARDFHHQGITLFTKVSTD